MKAIIRLDGPEWQIGTEVSVYFKDTMVQRAICEKETENIKLKEPKQCKDCVNCKQLGETNYCGMSLPENAQQNITTVYLKNINTRPDWCPIIKINNTLKEMPQDERDQANNVIKGLAALFGSSQAFEEE